MNKTQAQEGLNLNLHILTSRVDAITKTALQQSKIGITNSQYLVLKIIFLNTIVTQKNIADWLQISEAAVSRHVKNLRQQQLIDLVNPNSKHSQIILTPKGATTLNQAMDVLVAALTAKFSQYEDLRKLLVAVNQDS